MQKTCTNCSSEFEISESDLKFYEEVGPTIGGKKFTIPPPSLCAPCRMQRRLSFRNFFHYGHRTCDLSGKEMISMYDTNVSSPIYDMHEWWGDKWSALDYGIDFSEDQPFFVQLQTIHDTVPRMNIMNTQCENTDYSNMSFQARNCYLVGGCVKSEDCCYGHIVWQSKDCFDCLYLYRCERCYECVDCVDSYNLSYSRNCENCSDARFLVHCTGCKNCFGCVGIQNKQYYLFNQPLSKEEYEKRMEEFQSGSHHMISIATTKVQELIGSEIVKHYHGFQCEDVTGDYLYNCKNTFDSYDAKNCEDCRYLATTESFHHCHDGNYTGHALEWSYNFLTCYGHQVFMCHNTMNDCANVFYCQDCYSCKNCFGCVGLKNNQHCILNKQYTKEEYEVLVQKIIEYMQSAGEWGEFFPIEISPFGYNQTMSYEYFPMEKEEVLAKGWKWNEEQEEDAIEDPYEFPDSIQDVPDDICDRVLQCEDTKKPFKIIPKELEFLKEMELPLPRKCFMQRHKMRMALRNPRKLWDRACGKCNKRIKTTYASERPETVFCEDCYLAEVY